MRGGLILTEPLLLGFAPVLQMIQNGSIGLLTYEISLTGIIFTLSVSPENSKYVGIRGQVQTEFVIKLAVLSSRRSTYTLPDLEIRDYKRTMRKEEFLNEAKTQQDVWSKSILYGLEFSPSVVNFALFDNSNGRKLLDKMKNSTTDEKCLRIIDELLIVLSTHLISKSEPYEIGVLVMPNILNTITLYDYSELAINNPRILLANAYMKSIINILRLYFFHKLIMLDLHADNILITKDENQNSFILDFDRTNDAAAVNTFDDEDEEESSMENSDDEGSQEVEEEKEEDKLDEESFQRNLLMFNSLCEEEKNIRNLKEDTEEEYYIKEDKLASLKRKQKKFIIYIIDSLIEYDRKRKKLIWINQSEYKDFSDKLFNSLCQLRNIFLENDSIATEIAEKQVSNQIFSLSRSVETYYYYIPEITRTAIRKKTFAKSKLGGGNKTRKHKKSKKSKKGK